MALLLAEGGVLARLNDDDDDEDEDAAVAAAGTGCDGGDDARL